MNISFEVIGRQKPNSTNKKMIKHGVDVHEIAQLDLFFQSTFLSSENNKLIKRVSVIEVQKFEYWLKGGELALTTLQNFSTREAQRDLLKQLIKGESACLAFHPGNKNSGNLKIHEETLSYARKFNFPILLLKQNTTYSDIIEAVFKLDMDKQNRRINILDLVNQELFHYLSNHLELNTVLEKIGSLSQEKLLLLDSQLTPIASSDDLNQCEILPILETNQFKKFFNQEDIMKLLINKNKFHIKISDEKRYDILVAPISQGDYLKSVLFVLGTPNQFLTKLLDNIVTALSVEKNKTLELKVKAFEKASYELLIKNNFKKAQAMFQELKLTINNKCALVVMDINYSSRDHTMYTENIKLRIKNYIDHYLKNDDFSGWYKNNFIIYISSEEMSYQSRLAKQLREIMEQFFSHVKFNIGLSSLDTKVLSKSYEEAVHAITVGQQINSKVTSFDETGISQIFLDLNDNFYLGNFCKKTLNPLLILDPARKKELLITLKMFLDCNLNFKETADALYVHPNTVRYRIQQIKEIYKDEDIFINPDKRFNIQFSLKFMDFLTDE